MSVSDIGALISSYGFPIVACVAIAWFCYKQISAQEEQNEKHEAEVTKMTEAVNNNTLALQRLCEKMGGNINED